jgi:putative spermidine/putrescine transport system substrate-binding protein
MRHGLAGAKTAVLIAGMTLAAAAVSPARAETTLTFAGWGGVTQDAVLGKLFAGADKLGIKIRGERSGAWAGIKAHIMAGAPGWDLTEIGFARCEEASQSGKLMPIDYKIIDKSKMPANLSLPNYVGVFTFSYGIAYQKKKYGKNPPKSWADFYDVKKFPGRRSMLGNGLYALESALMADGVAPKDVYKVLRTSAGVDRAFKKLEQIKPHVAVWWRSTGQAMQLMRDGEVDMAIFPNGRALALVKDGVNIGFEWNQGFVDVECFMIPQNAKHPKAAFKLINLALDPKNQATFAATIGYGPVNPKAYKVGILKPDQIAWLPTAPQNIGKQIYADQTWYASKAAKDVYLRFSKFLQTK